MKYCTFLILSLLSILFSQFGENHPELVWKTLETEHFLIHFHNNTERTAYETMEIAEFIYDPVTTMYDFRPKSKTHIIIKDTDDFSNGSAYFYCDSSATFRRNMPWLIPVIIISINLCCCLC